MSYLYDCYHLMLADFAVPKCLMFEDFAVPKCLMHYTPVPSVPPIQEPGDVYETRLIAVYIVCIFVIFTRKIIKR